MEIETIEANLEDPAHQHAIRSLIDGYARDPMGNGSELSPEVLDRLIPGLRQHPTSRVFLALRAGDAVGVAVCFVGFSTFAGRPLINLHDLAVAAPHRRRGAARRLIGHVEAVARELGCCRITLEVRAENAPARALYRSLGFRDFEFGSGEEHVLFQQKSLSETG